MTAGTNIDPTECFPAISQAMHVEWHLLHKNVRQQLMIPQGRTCKFAVWTDRGSVFERQHEAKHLYSGFGKLATNDVHVSAISFRMTGCYSETSVTLPLSSKKTCTHNNTTRGSNPKQLLLADRGSTYPTFRIPFRRSTEICPQFRKQL